MSSRGILLFLHLLGFALWFGVTFASAIVTARANKADDRSVLAFAYRASHRILMGPGLLGMILVIVSGFGLTGVGGYGFFELAPHWLFQMQVLGVLAFAVGLLVQIPNSGRLARAAEATASADEESASFVRFRRRHALVTSINGFLLLVVTLLGALRPF